MNEKLEQLATLWEREARGYRDQIEEARAKGVLCEAVIERAFVLKQCAREVRRLISLPPTPTT